MKRDIPPGVNDKTGYEKVSDLLDIDEGLSEWEIDFAESVVKQLEDGRQLTEKQKSKLDQILDKHA